MNAITLEMLQGDTGPSRIFDLTREDGSVVDLTSNTGIDFKIYHPNTKTQTNPGNTTCSVVPPATGGQCIYAWNANDIPDAGVYRCKLVVQLPTGKESALIIIDVDSDPAQ